MPYANEGFIIMFSIKLWFALNNVSFTALQDKTTQMSIFNFNWLEGIFPGIHLMILLPALKLMTFKVSSLPYTFPIDYNQETELKTLFGSSSEHKLHSVNVVTRIRFVVNSNFFEASVVIS